MDEINNIKMGMTWITYIGSVYGVVKTAGLWQEDVWQLLGTSGLAFHFIVHEMACPSSVTVYDWNDTHQQIILGHDTGADRRQADHCPGTAEGSDNLVSHCP